METNFNFKSQTCTTRLQSEALLKLGLKKETADCYWFYCDIAKLWKATILSSTKAFKDYPTTIIPAWSLHRLIEMMPSEVKFPLSGMPEDFHFEIHSGLVRYHNGFVCCVMEGGGYYKAIIDCIEWLIKKGYFNKAYLCEK